MILAAAQNLHGNGGSGAGGAIMLIGIILGISILLGDKKKR